jgi:putative inorganic carbon (HCO3(-)) transporter
MSANQGKNNDYRSISPNLKKNGENGDRSNLKSSNKLRPNPEVTNRPANLTNPFQKDEIAITVTNELTPRPKPKTEFVETESTNKKTEVKTSSVPTSYAEEQKERKIQKGIEKDKKLLSSDPWLARNGHALTYLGIFLFTLVVYFRPYEWVPGLENFTSIALIFAVATLLIYLPTQFAVEGSLTILTTEVKCVIFLAFWSVLTIPIAKDPGMAWSTFNETLSKILIMFIVMVNTLRTQTRLKGLMWLSIGVGAWLSYQAIDYYQQGKFEVEGYRVNVDFGGMFGNPNDMALHLVIFTPIAFVLGIASKNLFSKIIYFSAAVLMVMANFVTFSRGGFLGLIAISVVLVWKFSKKNRLVVIGSALVTGFLVITFAPGNYWVRILSIFIPSLDSVGSADQRRELLERSIQVTLRNPWGIGLGNFPVVGIHNLQTHNAFTQVSSELGWIGLIVYVIFLVSPLRKLAAIERQMFSRKDSSWIYYLAIGIQASIIGYMVSSFFVSVAYQWFVYYPIAYAVCLRRIYSIRQAELGETVIKEKSLGDYFKPKTA